MTQLAQTDQPTNGQPQSSPGFTPESEMKILALLQEQTQLLQDINRNLVRSMEKEPDTRHNLRTRIVDVDMPIGSMIGLMFKWLVASIPVGIVVGVVWFILSAIIIGSSF